MAEIIFVCTGNTCRSPMAEALAIAMFAREGIEISVTSAGVSASGASCASKNAIAAMKREMLDLSAHKSRHAAAEILKNAALILTMTGAHLLYVKKICPTANAFTLGEFAGDKSTDVCDPFGGDENEYLACAAQIKALLEAALEKFREIAP